MDTSEVEAMVEDFSSNIDDLEEALEPLLASSLSTTTSKLPLLDKVKLYVHTAYAVESILFSTLRVNGVDAKSHPIFQELARVKEYFAKIKSAETAGAKRNMTVDKEAANRFIRHGLAGNDKYDRERAERMSKEKAGAKRKLEEMSSTVGKHTRFDGVAKRLRAAEETVTIVRASDVVDKDADERRNTDSLRTAASAEKAAKKAAKRQRRLERRLADQGQTGAVTDVDAVQQEGPEVAEQAPLSETTAEVGDDLDGRKVKRKKKHKKRSEAQQELEDKRAKEML